MNKLTPYDAALHALAAVTHVIGAKDIRSKALGLEEYARRARDPVLVSRAVEVRKLAERKAGELLIAMAERGERGRGRAKKSNSEMTLSDLGLTKNQSSAWGKLARLSDRDFAHVVARAQRVALAAITNEAELVREVRAEKQAEKKRKRAEKEKQLGLQQIHALNGKQYGVLYADPPWRFEVWSDDTGMDRSADNHYPTAALDKIVELVDMDKIAAEDAVLFMWATVPMLPHSIGLMARWGFHYRSHFVWVKDKVGTGYWNRNKHELLLIGTRGKVPAPSPESLFDSVVEAPVGEHSAKPKRIMEMIEFYYPTLPKIELFARSRRPGWDAWGNELPAEAAE